MRGSRSKIKKLLAVLLAVTVMTSSFDVKAVASAIGAAAGSTAAKVEDSMGADPEAGTEEQKTASGSSSEEGQEKEQTSSEEGQEKEQTSLESGQEKEQETSGEAQEDVTESTEQVKEEEEEDASEMIPEEGPEAPDKITDGAHPGERPGAEDVTEEEKEAVEADPETVPGTGLTEEIILKEHGNEIKETVSRNELVEERTEYSKKYRMEDGTYTSVVYSVPVHYEKAGEWKEINNTLLSCTADGETVYHNAAGSLIVSFPESMTGEEPVTVKKDGHTLSFRLEGEIKRSASAVKALQRSMAQVEDPDRAEAFREEGPSVGGTEQLRSRISYGNICEDTDLRYDLEGGRLKESLILKEYRDGLEGFRYVLDTGDMVPVLQDDGSIILYEKDSKKEVLFLAAPYLLDGAMEQNHEVGVELEEKEGAYILTYSLPQDWLAGEEREWPVILDPVVSAEPDISNIRDITVAQNFQYGADSGVLECGYRTGRGIERTYLKYAQLPEISPAQNIVEAVVRLCKPFDSSVTSAVEVHKVYNTWETSSITWNAQPSFNPLVEDYALVGDAGYYTWEVTDIVRGWYDGSNTGMMFKAPDTVEDGGKDEWKQFMSSDYSEYNDYEPALYISYRDNSGIEPYYTYETIDLGNAGTAYICDHTGQLKVVKEVSRYQSAVNPFSMSLVYNSDHFAKNGSGADDIQSSYGIDMCFGKGFSLDIVQRVETAELENAVGPYLIYRDGDGTDHYFAKQEDGTYKDEDGLGLTISVQGTTYTMKDDQGSTMTFRKGILTEMSDEAGNQIRIGYETATSAGEWFYSVYQKNRNGQDIRVADLRYSGTDSHVARITAATGQVQALTYDSGGRLTGISLDGAPVASYSYSGNRITGIRDLETGYGIDITYSGGRISSVTERSGSSSGGKYELLYSHEGTAYIDYGADRTKGTAD